MVLLVGCEIYAIVVLVTGPKEPYTDYYSELARKSLAIFGGVNIIDMLFWIWGHYRMGVWLNSTT